MRIFLISLIFISTNISALTEHQILVRDIAKRVGSETCIYNMCFGKTLQAIAWQESSFGLYILGDKGRTLEESSLGPFQIRLKTAKYIIEKRKLEKFYHLLDNDQLLINKLIVDIEFGATLAVNYVVMNYMRAIKNKLENPWFYAVSKYNGGSNNVIYVSKITEKLAKL